MSRFMFAPKMMISRSELSNSDIRKESRKYQGGASLSPSLSATVLLVWNSLWTNELGRRLHRATIVNTLRSAAAG